MTILISVAIYDHNNIPRSVADLEFVSSPRIGELIETGLQDILWRVETVVHTPCGWPFEDTPNLDDIEGSEDEFPEPEIIHQKAHMLIIVREIKRTVPSDINP